MIVEFYDQEIKTALDIYEVLDILHSKAMEDCGATEYDTTSEALEIMNKLLEHVGYECENMISDNQ